jgi:hypothetical protein
MCFFFTPSLIMPPSVQFRMRLCEGRFGILQVAFLQVNFFFFGISNLFQTQKSFWHRFKANSLCRNSSDSYGQVFISDEIIFVLLLVKMHSDVLVVKNSSRFNPRVSKNQSSKHYFICMNNKACFVWESIAYRSWLLVLDKKGLD